MNSNNYKSMNCEESSQSLFIPYYQKGYRLLYAPNTIFMFMKFFYAIYERVLKAKDLIVEKILEDLLEMNPHQRSNIQITNDDILEFQNRIKNNIYEPDI